MSKNADFIGKGFSFPLKIDDRGSIILVGGPEQVESSMVMVLSTAIGERPFRPQFGCAIWDLVFEPINSETLGLMEIYVRDALRMWEPRVEVEDVIAEPGGSDGLAQVKIDYTIKSTNDRRNLVFPFYSIPGDD